jgi:hypothetical protein
MTRWAKLLLLAVVVVALLWLVGPIQRALEVNLCLDDGGSWDEAAARCRSDASK